MIEETNEMPPQDAADKEASGGRRPSACCGSLGWELRGEEWHADPEPGLTYTIMPWSGQWVCIVFRGTRYKRGGQIGPLDDTLESAKDRCAEHYHHNATAQTPPDSGTKNHG